MTKDKTLNKQKELTVLFLLPESFDTKTLKRQINLEHHKKSKTIFYFGAEYQDLYKLDMVIVLHASSIRRPITVQCNPENIIYASMEPDELEMGVCEDFVKQFSKVISTSNYKTYKKQIIRQTVSTWWIGLKVKHIKGKHVIECNDKINYKSISNMRHKSSKRKLISVICSEKETLPGHRIRKNIIEQLKESEINNLIDFYGYLGKPLIDKADALFPYKFSIVIENDIREHYWTEKLADAFLAECIPFYVGCPNVNDYFDSESIIQLSTDPKEIISTIIKLANEYEFNKRITAVRTSKQLVLNQYNITRNFRHLYQHTTKQQIKIVTLYPNYIFKTRFVGNIIRAFFKIINLTKLKIQRHNPNGS